MRNFISLLFAFALSCNAQIKEEWKVIIPDVLVKNEALLTIKNELIESGNGAIILDLSWWHRNPVHQISEDLNLTQKVWINSKGEIVYRWKNRGTGSMPIIGAILHFNDDYIFTAERIHGGRINIYQVKNGNLHFTKTEIGSTIFFEKPTQVSSNVFYGATGALNEADKQLTVTKYRIQTKFPTFFIQQSEDLETWKNVLEVPKSEVEKEFFRIAPDSP